MKYYNKFICMIKCFVKLYKFSPTKVQIPDIINIHLFFCLLCVWVMFEYKLIRSKMNTRPSTDMFTQVLK